MKYKFKLYLSIVLVVIISALSIFTYRLFFILSYDKLLPVIEIGQQVQYSDLITNVKNGELLNGDDSFLPNQVGEYQIVLKFKTKLNDYKEEMVVVNCVDLTSPQINAPEYIIMQEYKEIDVFKDVEVSDNSNEDIKAQLIGTYDPDMIGVYNLQFYACDSSNNETFKDVTIIVEQELSINNKFPLSNDITFFKTPTGHLGYIKNGIYYIEGVLIANKTYDLPSNYGNGVTTAAQNALDQMKKAASEENIVIKDYSTYRSYTFQYNLYNRYVSEEGQVVADGHSARPGFSEHQSGMAFDVKTDVAGNFENTKAYAWLKENCYKYGFIIRYVENKTNETGYIFEPWHYRYVGVNLATKLYNNGDWLTVEDYFGISSRYGDPKIK